MIFSSRNKQELVKFNNGNYGIRIRKRMGVYEFMDLVSPNYSWGIKSKFFDECQGSKDRCLELLENEYEVIDRKDWYKD